MTKEKILAMKPGRELNIKVAEAVMGHEVISDEIFRDAERYIDKDGRSAYGPLQSYSEDISAAQLVVEKLIKLGQGGAVFWGHYGTGIRTPAEAICKVALLVVLGNESKKEEMAPLSRELDKLLEDLSNRFSQNQGV